MTWASAVFEPRGTSRRRAVGGQDHGLVVGGAEHRSPADVVDDEQVAALAGELGAGVVEHRAGLVAGLGGEADHDLPGPGAVAGELGEDVGGLGQLERRARRRPTS